MHILRSKIGLVKFIMTLMAAAAMTASTAQAKDEKILDISTMPSGAYYPDLPHSHIYWTIDHGQYSKTHGRFSKFDGSLLLDAQNLNNSKLEFIIDASSIDTNVPELDAHLISEAAFNVEQYPHVTFNFTSFEPNGDNAGKVIGDLTMLGVTKSVALDTHLNGIKPRPKDAKWTRMGFTAHTDIDRTDWGMGEDWMVIGKVISLTIDVEFLLKIDVEEEGEE